MAEISSCQANYLFIGLISGLGGFFFKIFFIFFSFFLSFFPFLDSYLLLLARPQQGKVELLNMKKEIIVHFFLAGSFFNLRDVSVLGRRRKHVDT